MEEQLSKVAEFHRGIKEKTAAATTLLDCTPDLDLQLAKGLRHLIASIPTQQRQDSHLCRRALMAIEELAEWIEAHVEADQIAAADALGDRLYVLLGDAVATGLPIERIFDEVHRSNMTKLPSNDATGKGTKATGFERPQLQKILLDQTTKG